MLIPISVLDNERFKTWWFKKHKTRPLMTLVYTANIITVNDEWFDFDQTGIAAAILPIEKDGQMLDLVAWKPTEPDKWWTRCGKTYNGYLGWDELDGIECKTPYDWLLNGCQGFCKL